MAADRYDVLVDLTPLDTPSRWTGTGRYLFELGRALAALSPSEARGLKVGGLTSLDGASPHDLLWEGSPTPIYDAESGWLMARRMRLPFTLRRLRPRLFHAPYHLGTPRGSGVPRVVSCLDLIRFVLHEEYFGERHFYRRLLLAIERARFQSATRVMAISQHTADDLMRLLNVPASRIDITYLGVDLERYRPPATDDEAAQARAARERYQLQEGGYLFYVGAADPRKNVDVLVKAYARAKLSDVELVLIGKLRRSDEQAYERALAEAGQPRGVRFLGFVPEEDLPAIMCGALAFVFCSTYEGFGNVPVEAMACGCPVITTGATSMRETVGDAGLLVPPRDVEATTDAIRRLATEPTLRRELAEAGIARAARFSWHNTALATVESYERALPK
jgi:glycosyltransferase involved in cell wall biosynthesis